MAVTLMLTGKRQVRVEKSGHNTAIGKLGDIILLHDPGLLDAYYNPWQLRAAILQPLWV